MTDIFFIMTQALPSTEEQPFGPAWWDMKFVRVNDMPVPFHTEEDAREYMRVWGFQEPDFTVWKLTKL